MGKDISIDNFVDQKSIDVNIQYWDAHCKLRGNSSIMKENLDCEGYRNLVKIGKAGLPFIYNAVKEDKFNSRDFGWINNIPFLVKEIIGEDFIILEEMKGRVYELRDFTIGWLESYVSSQ